MMEILLDKIFPCRKTIKEMEEKREEKIKRLEKNCRELRFPKLREKHIVNPR